MAYQKKRELKSSPKTISGKKFAGILLDPIDVPISLLQIFKKTDEDPKARELAKRIEDAANNALHIRLMALMDHYGTKTRVMEAHAKAGAVSTSVEEDMIRSLHGTLVCLSSDFLPGFGVKKPKKSRPNQLGGRDLFDEISERLQNHGGTVIAACKFLSRHGPERWRHHSPENLESAFYSSKKIEWHDAMDLFSNPAWSAVAARFTSTELIERYQNLPLKQSDAG